MRIQYIIPGPMHKTELGKKEVDRRLGKLKEWAADGTAVTISAVDHGPQSIESMYEEYLSVPGVAKNIKQAEKEGHDAVIVGCFGDPGLDGLREISDRLVVGSAGASMAMAATLGHKFSIVTVTDSIVPALEKLAWETGVYQKLCSVRAINLPVIEINKNHNKAANLLVEVGKKAIEKDRAEVLILGCMSMGFLDVAEQMMGELKVPVINPSKAGLKFAEALISCRLTHSRKGYMTPPKMEKGSSIEDLLIK